MSTEKMPEKIYATPRGSGTVSGVWTDMKMDDEERGEYEYIRTDLNRAKKSLKRELVNFYIWVLDNQEGSIVGLADKGVVEDIVNLYLSKKNITF